MASGMTLIDCSRIVRVDKVGIDPKKMFFYGGANGRVTGDYRIGDDGKVVEQDGG